MIGYVTIGTNDLEKASVFYDNVLEVLGGSRAMDFGTTIVWGSESMGPSVGVGKPFDGNPATVGNGMMISLLAPNNETVDAVHAAALANGGTDEGAPGPRGENTGFYGAYFRDLDGNKLAVFHFTTPE